MPRSLARLSASESSHRDLFSVVFITNIAESDFWYTQPASFKYLVTEMLCWAAGGPQKYTGKDMESSHRHLRITPGEWDAFMDDVAQTLDKFAVPAAERAEVVAIVESTRHSIVVA